MLNRSPAARKAFTLIELMIVVSIIGILASVAYPRFKNYINESRNAEAPMLLDDLTRLEAAFFLRPRSNAAGVVLEPCFLTMEVTGLTPKNGKKLPFIPSTPSQALGFAPTGLLSFVYAVNATAYACYGIETVIPPIPAGLHVATASARRGDDSFPGTGEITFRRNLSTHANNAKLPVVGPIYFNY